MNKLNKLYSMLESNKCYGEKWSRILELGRFGGQVRFALERVVRVDLTEKVILVQI